jgi:hypothetical protein
MYYRGKIVAAKINMVEIFFDPWAPSMLERRVILINFITNIHYYYDYHCVQQKREEEMEFQKEAMKLQKEDMELQKEDMELQKEDMEPQKKDLEFQNEDLELQKEDMELRKEDMEPQRKKMERTELQKGLQDQIEIRK